MIDAKELRITNWVNMDNEPYFIRAGEQIDDYCDRMDGIPISDGALKRLGFVKGATETIHDKTEFTHHAIAISLLRRGNDYLFYYNGNFVNLKYVHRLQNVVHSLTGQELGNEFVLSDPLEGLF